MTATGGGLPTARQSATAYPAYASQALAATEPWIAEHPELLTRYIGALLRALRWIYDPAARPAVEALIATETGLGVSPADAASALAAFTDPARGLVSMRRLDDAGIAQVIALRARYGARAVDLGKPDGLPRPTLVSARGAAMPGSWS